MKKFVFFPISVLFLFGCEQIRDLVNQTFETEFNREFEWRIPEGSFSQSEPFREVWEGQLDLSDSDFPDEVRNNISELFEIQVPGITLEITEMEGELSTPASLWGNLDFTDPETGQVVASFPVPEVQIQGEGTVIHVPIEEGLVDQLTNSLLTMPKLDYSLEFLFSGEGPVNANTHMTVPMEIALQLL
ncbi:hypothetical protein [Pleomorphovibrio marinus]|uniref:hypothetical protein n=1 Tax=Pleomorphovibrio marinus TaxID=2164132 RepID=UPI000E0B0975|nr:hypothetical protein [Pleomorphovibrio marinus]